MAASIRTNPAHLRAVLAHLRRAGLVRSSRGPGGGWSLTRAAELITLGDAWRALPSSGLAVTQARPGAPVCPVGTSVAGQLDRIGERLSAAIEAELDHTTVAALLPQ